MSKKNSKLIPVILCGGIGSRLWPLSRQHFPKQFHPLVTNNSMLLETVKRVNDKKMFQVPIVVCNSEHRFLVAEQLRQANIKKAQIVLEPVPMNTAPAITVACELIAGNEADANVLILPADHVISDIDSFHRAIRIGVSAAESGAIVTFGLEPKYPETGYGYIKVGPASDLSHVYAVDTFIEKPDIKTAQNFLKQGGYLWNSGMFLFKASMFLDELMRHAPKTRKACRRALNLASQDLDFLRLDQKAFSRATKGSIDRVLIEKTEKTKVIPVSIGWSDVGAWDTLWALTRKDVNNNVKIGNSFVKNTRNCYIRSDNKLVTVFGVQDLIIVNVEDTVLVMHQEEAQNLGQLVDELELDGRPEATTSLVVYRPWGFYRAIDQDKGFKVKRIVVKPGGCLSLQMHYHRSEHWIVVDGTAKVLKDKEEFILKANESTYIPAKVRHRLENIGTNSLHVIEVQTGQYVEEDDIVRFEDIYKRC
ncbi:MAG: Alginate biosynthesis protein AlgA [Alphaproteobacteria bacterium MarineAlpha3_Bin5]|nr:mannose-1-phosphate guanylyltransferase/mannose-6-phosphate isomerase [Magnetovibrio sp.]PPR80164.1 MAG: Alginate biosynthesis protein AlgA [Alphaproteobacteria bacterium MarineAlpha3_Bin5]